MVTTLSCLCMTVNHTVQIKMKIFHLKLNIYSGDELEGVWHKTDLKMSDETWKQRIEFNFG